MFKGVFSMVFGIFWLLCGWYVQGSGAPASAVVGIFAIGFLSLAFGLGQMFFGATKAGNRARTAGRGWRDDGEPAASDDPTFEPDAVIARYMAQKAASQTNESGGDTGTRPAPTSFGRKRT